MATRIGIVGFGRIGRSLFRLGYDRPDLEFAAVCDSAEQQSLAYLLNNSSIEGKFKDRPLPFWTENISSSGMLIKTEEPLSRDAGIFISFFLPDGTHVSGYGEITRVIPLEDEPGFLYGVKFTSIDQDVKSAIKEAVK